MKYIKTYENLLKGKTKDDIINSFKNSGGVVQNNIFKDFLIHGLDFNLLPRDAVNGYLIIDGNLNIMNSPQLLKNGLPDKMMIYSDLIISGGNISKLPNGLVVKGDLEIEDSGLSELPKDLIVGRNLYIEYNNISVIPSTIKVKGEIFTRGNPLDIKKLPKNLKFYEY